MIDALIVAYHVSLVRFKPRTKVHRASRMYEKKIETDSNVNKNSTTRLSTKIDTYEDEIRVYKEIHDLAKESLGGSMS